VAAVVGTVVDSTGRVVAGVALGVGFVVVGFVGVVRLVAGRAVEEVTLADSSRAAEVARRGSASATNTGLADGVGVGTGVGLGFLSSALSAGSSPGSGSTALDGTGPPTRLTQIRPP